ncbi:cation-dependent mannose-6-phosphate receptor isoform X1 [Hippoglossus hippoglossus]|uniref:cation-dependent mannose-6-phosphate receptor isoform X1 n=1 Tax=Hippoglossus hippoglossus TaxID=8267 RepID=UPI00148DF717|nr:cation-dependent mannose-6-phosphate receptor isoform X1 [Hippoglossus hippoglossus]
MEVYHLFQVYSRRPFLVWTLVVQLVLCGSVVFAADGINSCKLLYDSKSEWTVLNRLAPLTNKNFTVVSVDKEESYKYIFQLCGDAGGVQGAGLIQVDSKGTETKTTVIGQYNATEAFGAGDWVMLIYRNGDPYNVHCSKEKRKAFVMISCNRKVDMGQLEVLQEEREREQDCFYLFKIDSSAVCPDPSSKLSPGSILLIIGVCLLAVYLIGGFLYQRLIVGAKGMEQFPNYAFWVEFGNLTADGCDFVCRSGNREGSPAYRAVAPESLEEEPEERDDHLLPM